MHARFAVAASGAVLTEVGQNYVGNGTYAVTYIAVASDHSADWTFKLSVSLHGEDISGSPFETRMYAGLAVQAVLDESRSTLVASAGQQASLFVHTVFYLLNIIYTMEFYYKAIWFINNK